MTHVRVHFSSAIVLLAFAAACSASPDPESTAQTSAAICPGAPYGHKMRMTYSGFSGACADQPDPSRYPSVDVFDPANGFNEGFETGGCGFVGTVPGTCSYTDDWNCIDISAHDLYSETQTWTATTVTLHVAVSGPAGTCSFSATGVAE